MRSPLIELASKNSPEDRRQLLRDISTLFADGAEAYADREILLFGDVLYRLLEQAPVDDRVAVSERVADLAQTPRDLALRLAGDVAAVAAPVLSRSPVLTDSDVMDLARTQSQDHLLAISRRRALSEDVTDVLIERGNSAVLETVAGNPGAQLSSQGLETLVDQATENAALGDALARRSDIPSDVAAKLVAVLGPAGRRRLELFLASPDPQITEIVGEAQQLLASSRSESRNARLQAKVLVANVRAGRCKLDTAIEDLIIEQRVLDIAFVLAELAGIPESHAVNVLHKVNSLGIAVVCRTVGLTTATYERLSALRCERLRLNSVQRDAMVYEYRKLDRPTAEKAIFFHKVRSSALNEISGQR
jgi:uncharacterized protein (DUF2336 family)